jgi:protein-S-isoprenylcysteine O-methyltransferase Ste14
MKRVLVLSAAHLVVMAGIPFTAAGRLDWPMAWAYAAVLTFVTLAVLLAADRQMLRVRAAREKHSKPWDPLLAGASFLLYWPGAGLVAGLDHGRLHLSPPVPLPIRLLALLAFTLGFAFAAWAMVANRFFAKFVRVQTERRHLVVAHGPYAWVRHPGYAGTLLAFIALPVALGSLWALLPAAAGLSLLVIRTFLEDNTLLRELDGYPEYARRVRRRLIPGLW